MNQPQIRIYEFDEFRVDAAKRLLMKGGGTEIPLTPKVFDTLLYLVRHGGRVIEKDELILTDSAATWDSETPKTRRPSTPFGSATCTFRADLPPG